MPNKAGRSGAGRSSTGGASGSRAGRGAGMGGSNAPGTGGSSVKPGAGENGEGGEAGERAHGGAGSAGSAGGMGPLPKPGTCQGYSDKLEDCKLIRGAIDCSTASDDPTQLCSYGCIEAAACDTVADYLCDSRLTSIDECLSACKGFVCDDDAVIPLAYRCDGIFDCSGDEDEAECAICDGGPIEGDYFCDGIDDCSDGRDEQDCPTTPTFSCDDGMNVPGPYRCDGYRDCADGTDEAGCATLTCGEP